MVKKITEMAYPNDFDIEEFKTISSFAKRIKYCQERLQRVASGTARIVYKVDNEKVLKLAKNQKGIAQNEVEISQGNDYYLRQLGIVAEVFEDHPESHWLEMELCTRVTPKKFERIVGISFDEFDDAIREFNDYLDSGHRISPRSSNLIDSNDFLNNIVDYIGNYRIPVGDLTRLSTYGVTAKNQIVIVDFGLTYNVLDLHYT
jgi:hypothetical protein